MQGNTSDGSVMDEAGGRLFLYAGKRLEGWLPEVVEQIVSGSISCA